jgi:formate dehydrogenase major subunit
VNGVDEFRKSLEPFTMAYASKTCEVPSKTLERVAKENVIGEALNSQEAARAKA